MCYLRFFADRLFPDGVGTRTVLTFFLVGILASITWIVLSSPELAKAHGETVIQADITLAATMVGFWSRDRQTNNGGGA